MVERYPIWSTPYPDTYIRSQHHSNCDRDADAICDSDVNSYSEPGAVIHADVDRDIGPFAERDSHSFSHSIAKPGTHVHPDGDGNADAV